MKANVLLFGPVGSGKSRSIRTLLAEYPDERGQWHKGAGKQVFNLSLEAGAEASHSGLTCELGFHRATVLPTASDWEVSRDFIERLGRLTNTDDMIKMVVPVTIRQQYQHWLDMLDTRSKFVCEICQQDFGSVREWGDDHVFVNDGLSGITELATQYINGPKPFLPLTLYQPVMGLIRGYINECVGVKHCSYVLIAHWDREKDEVTRQTTITVDTLGQKLAPRLLKMFDEIAVTHHEAGKKFWWSTLEDGVELKCRRLPYSDNITPDFGQLFK